MDFNMDINMKFNNINGDALNKNECNNKNNLNDINIKNINNAQNKNDINSLYKNIES